MDNRIQAAAVTCAIYGRREYLQGRVVALCEQLQAVDGAEAFSVVDQLIATANELVDVVAGGS